MYRSRQKITNTLQSMYRISFKKHIQIYVHYVDTQEHDFYKNGVLCARDSYTEAHIQVFQLHFDMVIRQEIFKSIVSI